jgi:hypothetical protein
MRQHLAWPHIHPPRTAGVSARSSPGSTDRSEHWQTVKDKLAVGAVLLLVLATAAVFVLYVIHQAPHWSAGEFTAFATPAPAAMQSAAGAAQAASTTVAPAYFGLGRVPLILISTVVEMGIFVALGLYLRHDLKRKR